MFNNGDEVTGLVPMTNCRISGTYVGPGYRAGLHDVEVLKAALPTAAAYTSSEKQAQRAARLSQETVTVPLAYIELEA